MSAAPPRHIACCVAPLAAVRAAVAEASRLRLASPGRLSVVHAVRWPREAGGRTRAAALAEGWAWLRAECAPVRGAEAVLLVGEDPARAVARWADLEGVDLIVTGEDRAGVASGFSTRLAARAPCRVVVARRSAPRSTSAARPASG